MINTNTCIIICNGPMPLYHMNHIYLISSAIEVSLRLRTALGSSLTAAQSGVLLARIALEASAAEGPCCAEARALLWKACLGVTCIDADFYMQLIKEGPSQADAKIRDDTFRTFKHNEAFWAKVDETQLIRALNAFERYHNQAFCAHAGIAAASVGEKAKIATVQGEDNWQLVTNLNIF
jgi:hypothetical protein